VTVPLLVARIETDILGVRGIAALEAEEAVAQFNRMKTATVSPG